VAPPREALRSADASRPGTHDRHGTAGGCHRRRRRRPAMRVLPFRRKRLELADGDRKGVLADHAVALAKALLRAEAAAHLRQFARLAEHVGRAVEVALLQEPERARDVVVDRACDLTWRCGTLDAALRLHP